MTLALVTGASGSTGRPLVEELRAEGVPVRAATRSASESLVCDHVAFDWMDPKTHAPALDGVDRVYVLGPGLMANPDAVVIPFVQRALAAGVRRVVLLSASAIAEGAPGLGMVHAFLRQHVPEWAVLRPSWFMQNFVDPRHHHARGLLAGTLVTATGKGRVGFVDARDIAAVAARALVDPVSHNAAYVITGLEALSYDDVVQRVGQAVGRVIEHRVVESGEVMRHMIENGIPDAYAQLLTQLEADVRRGVHAGITDTVHRVTGRQPRRFDAFAREHVAHWR